MSIIISISYIGKLRVKRLSNLLKRKQVLNPDLSAPELCQSAVHRIQELRVSVQNGETGSTTTLRQRQFPLTTSLMEAELVTSYKCEIIAKYPSGRALHRR